MRRIIPTALLVINSLSCNAELGPGSSGPPPSKSQGLSGIEIAGIVFGSLVVLLCCISRLLEYCQENQNNTAYFRAQLAGNNQPHDLESSLTAVEQAPNSY